MNGSPSSSGGMGEAATSEAGGCAGLPVRSRLAEDPLMSIGFRSSYSIDVDGLLGGKLGENDGDVPGNISADRYAYPRESGPAVCSVLCALFVIMRLLIGWPKSSGRIGTFRGESRRGTEFI